MTEDDLKEMEFEFLDEEYLTTSGRMRNAIEILIAEVRRLRRIAALETLKKITSTEKTLAALERKSDGVDESKLE